MNDAERDFLSDNFWTEWFSQRCPKNDDGDPVLYDPFLDENLDEDDYYEQLFEELKPQSNEKGRDN